jgi:polyhydroxyalkanoate synthesis regulator protein
MKLSITRYFLCIFLVVTTFSAYGSDALRIKDLSLQQSLEAQFQQRIKQAYPDLKFSIVVDLKPVKTVELDVFSFQSALDDENQSVVERIKKVTLFTEKSLPEKITSELIGLNSILIHQEVRTFSKLNQETAAESVKENTKEDKQKDYLDQLAEQFGAPYLVIIGFLVAGLFIIFWLTSKLISGILAIAEALQAGSSGEARSTKKVETSSAQSSWNSVTHNFRPDQLKSMLAECYWNKQDASAAALIRKYPEVDIYKTLRFGCIYLDYLKHVIPGKLDFINDPYFINPNPVFWDISPEDTPIEALGQCSEMRFDAANFHPIEVIKLHEKTKDFTFVPKNKSHLRPLQFSLRVKFKDVSQESEVLKSSLSKETLWLLPSLYRMTLLTQEQFQWVLSQVTIRDLAQAWEGPEWVLQAIMDRLPEKKRDILEQFNAKRAGDRHSTAFHTILNLCTEAVEKFPSAPLKRADAA